MSDWQRQTVRITVVFLATSVALIVPGLAGVGASPPLAAALAVLAGGLFAVRDQLASLVESVGYGLSTYAGDLWLAPLLGAFVVLVVLDASPAELQTVGGLAGLVGMGNYFLRPVYFAGYSIYRRLGGST